MRLHCCFQLRMSFLSFISVQRNNRGKDRLFLRQGNPIFDFFVGLYEGGGIKEV